ncbi:4-hydroxybenzoate octaprenyltransferase [Rheinheimera mesophila]|uniref:4-hydroxybenzoate octaprenyltransferase n=1 Tax=Rheinheimera mesophila TaxID=1547515 RepID=A0A3P3QRF6_9GAMM|nr:4-hydroxybenzoate octaprenyltransferase [Rheinheimera mesophila]KKL01693.1 4-hydroxybenzoate polyprenyltransferase [Rheinheimera mesophila]RRJ23856.1 4-hydroxybenzoate octaprenyltransferase [Rheinheimera mesophila]
MRWQLEWRQWPYYRQLMRLDRPIGIYLLLWPTWWALWLVSSGLPDLTLLMVFSAGVVLMRSAGCVINDYADRNFDGHVERTKARPLAAGLVSSGEALQLFVLLLGCSATLLLFLNPATQLLSFVAVLLATLYPFMKRFTYLPQFVLGAAYSWGIPMAAMAVTGSVPLWVWALYLANLAWTVAYDTFYAMVDREDDRKIGVKSTALLFGRYCHPVIAALQLVFLSLMAWVGHQNSLGVFFYAALLLVLLSFIHQHWQAKTQGRAGCFQAFLNNHYSGLLLFAGIGLSLL